MATIPAINPVTAAVASSANATPTAGYSHVVVSAPGLLTTEQVTILTTTPGGVAPLNIALTSTTQVASLTPGPVYSFAKNVTASAVGVFVDLNTDS